MLLQHNLFFNTALYVCHKVNIAIKGKDFKQQIKKSNQGLTECCKLTPSVLLNGGGRPTASVPLLGIQAYGPWEMQAIWLSQSLLKRHVFSKT